MLRSNQNAAETDDNDDNTTNASTQSTPSQASTNNNNNNTAAAAASSSESHFAATSGSGNAVLYPGAVAFAPQFFTSPRHFASTLVPRAAPRVGQWRMKERMKTVSVSLVLCLNIGVDPPDVVKTSPCARMECWTDPLAQSPQKALDNIGKLLQAQYERWQPRARYKQSLDPTVDEVKKMCTALRRSAKGERVVFHYNGHGVPRPTNNGEIWVFNRNYTQYIPLSIYELQTWMGAPSIFVFDCSNAGLVVHWFLEFAKQREVKRAAREAAAAAGGASSASAPANSGAAPLSARSTGSTNNDEDDVESPRGGGNDGDGGGGGGGSGLTRKSSTGSLSSLSAPKVSILRDCILLAACAINQFLPTNPKWPVDIFTACLTTPVKVALRYSADGLLCSIDYDMIDKMPGRLTDRKTPLGELNWIFTAVTDTIAWLTLPRPLFQRLFRQDLLVASLFRNFLLAARVMRAGNCTPVSVPALPDTYNHPMWHAWDLAADLCLAQLPQLVNDPNYVYDHSPFFADQLTSFEIWLDHTPNPRAPPAQLPIVLQVLLSQTHRQRALMLLGRFLDVGAWAVNLALSVGIFPYVLKLLQSPVLELRRVLVFIWTKLLALDKSCQLDLVKDNGHNYFINVLSAPTVPPEQRTQAAFVLCCVMSHCRPGQQACLSSNLLTVALAQINDSNAQLRRWCVFCLGRLWEQHEDAKRAAVHEQAHERLCALLTDDEPDVRAAVVWALAAFIGGARDTRRANIELNIGLTLMVVTADGSHLVRRELVFALARLVQCFQPHFIGAHRHMLGERERLKREADLLAMSPSDGGAGGAVGGGATSSPDTLRRVSRESNESSLRRVSRDPSGSRASVAIPESPGIKRARSAIVTPSSPTATAQPLISLSSSAAPMLAPDDVSDAAAAAAGEASSALFAPTELSIYVGLWKMVLALAQDPYPNVAHLASLIYSQIADESQLQLRQEQQLQQLQIPTAPLPTGGAAANESPTESMMSPGSVRRGLSNFLRRTPVPPIDTASVAAAAAAAQSGDYDGGSPPGSLKYGTMPSSPLGGRGASAHNVGAGLHLHHGDDDGVPDALRSTLFEWSADRFSLPLNEVNAALDASSHDYLAANWRRARNEELVEKVSQRQRRAPKKFDEQIAILKQPVGAVAKLLFHPSEDILVVGDDRDSIHLWRWRDGRRVRTWTNSGNFHTRTTALTFVNENDHALLLVGSHDGVVRLWDLRDSLEGVPAPATSSALPTVADATGASPLLGAYVGGADAGEGGSSGRRRGVRLTAAWRGLSDAVAYQRRGGAGMVVSWQQGHGLLMVSGDVTFVRAWDAQHELVVQDIPTHAPSSVTCLASDQRGGHLVVAGCGDGSVRLFDWRVPPRYSHVNTFQDQHGWIVNVATLPHDDDQIISGTVTGNVKLWDLRTGQALRTYTTAAATNDVTTAVAVHPWDPVIACGSQNQRIKVLSFTGDELSTIRYHDGFLGQRIGPISALAFHPRRALLAAGATDSIISIYSGRQNKK